MTPAVNKVITNPTPKTVILPGPSVDGSSFGIKKIANPLNKQKITNFIPMPFENMFCIIAFSQKFCAKRASEGGAGIPFPLTPFPSRAARAISPSEARRYLSSKYFRATFRISHQQEFCKFFGVTGLVASRLRRSARPLCARRKAAESHSSPNETETFIRI